MEKELGAMTIQDGFDKFMRMKRLQKLSPETILYYESCFRYFKKYFNPSNPAPPLPRIPSMDTLSTWKATRTPTR